MAARVDPTASGTLRMSSVSVSTSGTSDGENLSEHPHPRRSVMISLERWAKPRRNRDR
jgi:hypothetical protein